jgi:hypothetical protein
MTSSLPAGGRSITASYSGDVDFASTSSVAVAVSVAPASTQPAVLPAQLLFNNKHRVVSVGLTVQFSTAAPGANPPSGLATFELIAKARGHKAKPHEKVLGRVSLVNGRTSLWLKAKQVLNQRITVVYGGDADYQPATLNLPVVTPHTLKTGRE